MYVFAIYDSNDASAHLLKTALSESLSKLNVPNRINCFSNYKLLYDSIVSSKVNYDFIFLDVDYNSENIFKFARTLHHNNYLKEIIITSSNIEHSLEGYDVGACQYLIKPIKQEQLLRLFSRIFCSPQWITCHPFYLRNGNIYQKLYFNDIVYIESIGRKLNIHTKTEVIEYKSKLSDIEKLLPACLFIRCHQSFIISNNYIKKLTSSFVLLTNDISVPISRSYKNNIKNLYEMEY